MPHENLLTLLPINLSGILDPDVDHYKIQGSPGNCLAQIKKPSGEVIVVAEQEHGAIQQITRYNPSKITVDARRELEAKMVGAVTTQAKTALTLGLDPSTVSKDLKKARDPK
jgi:hypothetical protein